MLRPIYTAPPPAQNMSKNKNGRKNCRKFKKKYSCQVFVVSKNTKKKIVEIKNEKIIVSVSMHKKPEKIDETRKNIPSVYTHKNQKKSTKLKTRKIFQVFINFPCGQNYGHVPSLHIKKNETKKKKILSKL